MTMTKKDFTMNLRLCRSEAPLVAKLFANLKKDPTFDTVRTFVYDQSYVQLGAFWGQFFPVIDGLSYTIEVDGHNAMEETIIQIILHVFEYYFCRPGDLFHVERMIQIFNTNAHDNAFGEHVDPIGDDDES